MAEPRYTLDEAQRLLALRECSWHGHDWNVLTNMGSAAPIAVTCGRCGQTHAVDPGAVTNAVTTDPDEPRHSAESHP